MPRYGFPTTGWHNHTQANLKGWAVLGIEIEGSSVHRTIMDRLGACGHHKSYCPLVAWLKKRKGPKSRLPTYPRHKVSSVACTSRAWSGEVKVGAPPDTRARTCYETTWP
ncbi:hypothetical protein PoB_001349100 [Plakobranchus ocellatus]|uniref:Uncharacterized protein n=1 Tax=Plakobranchus ocellatus TaxID=259542 RepID=A0AAV3YU68_9GAST|nr:hypothetical protein PoB_001349100 [Plakobranchus ocellatus]